MSSGGPSAEAGRPDGRFADAGSAWSRVSWSPNDAVPARAEVGGALESHGGGAAQSRLAGRPGLHSGSAGLVGSGGGTTEVLAGSEGLDGRTLAASRPAQSTKVGQVAKRAERQYASWWAAARDAGRTSAKQRCRWSGRSER